jgi:cell division septation protein DedD
MLQSSETETEILLGNKQLLGVFFAVVVLLGVAFAGGYKIGQSAAKKTLVSTPPAMADEPAASPAANTGSSTAAGSGGETHTFPGSGTSGEQRADSSKTVTPAPPPEAGAYHPPAGEDAAPLGSKHSKAVKATATEPVTDTGMYDDFTPVSGQTFLQVMAAGRDESQATADVLHKRGFRAHAVPKPGSAKIYRVLIGPIRDSGDLASTRDALRKVGFREIYVQRY